MAVNDLPRLQSVYSHMNRVLGVAALQYVNLENYMNFHITVAQVQIIRGCTSSSCENRERRASAGAFMPYMLTGDSNLQ